MITAPKTALLADDDPAIQWLYQNGLAAHLPGFDIATVSNGQEAIDYLSAHPVAVLVTDIAMPQKDGFEVLAFVRRHHPNLPVIVLASLAPKQVIESAPQLGALQVLQKPVAPELLAKRILAAYSETTRGRISGVPLAPLVQLVQAERKSCSLLLRMDDKRGRLHFLSGELVNAYAFELDTDGEDAARYLLALGEATVDFERSLHNHIRTIHTPLATLLLQVAQAQDEGERDRAALVGDAQRPATGQPSDAGHDPPTDRVAQGGQPASLAAAGGQPSGSVSADLSGAPDARSLADATAELQAALSSLRHRAANSSALLGAAAPSIGNGVVSLAIAHGGRGTRQDADDARLSTAWREVSVLATRLARAAEALGAAAPDGD